jgi:hypothetical protein
VSFPLPQTFDSVSMPGLLVMVPKTPPFSKLTLYKSLNSFTINFSSSTETKVTDQT